MQLTCFGKKASHLQKVTRSAKCDSSGAVGITGDGGIIGKWEALKAIFEGSEFFDVGE
jgi:hypothetical protein